MATTRAGRNWKILLLWVLLWPALFLVACAHTVPGSSGSTSTSTSPTQTAIAVTISPLTAVVPSGGAQVFMASVTGAGNASTAVSWSVDGIAGGNAIVGTVIESGSPAAAGNTGAYTAPAVPPSPAVVTVTATSVADNSKSASASVTITCANSNLISPAAVSLALGQTQTFVASLCVASGTPVAWDVNGVANGNATLGTIATVSANTVLYTAPSGIPAANPVTIHATAIPAGGSPATASATITLISNVSISVSPPTATLAPGQRVPFTAAVLNTSDTAVSWNVNGIADGNSAVGQICVSGTNPCDPPALAAAGAVDYLAPASPPAMNPVVLTAISLADPSRTATALITVTVPTGSVAIAISPPYAFLAPSTGTASTQQFFATVTGASNTGVTWSVQSAVANAGCGGAACGSISASGAYTAPTLAPSPNAIAVIATSLADQTKSAAATVALTSGPTIETILPSSAYAGAVESFPLAVQGAGFAAGSGSSASVILLNGSPRGTNCASATACATALNPADLPEAGIISVQIENPGSPGALSNPVFFVIQPLEVPEGAISLTASQPVVTGADIIVVEPTTAASSSPINVDFVGFLTGGNTCGIQGSPLTIVRPASGSGITSLCIHGTGLDPSFTYSFTGPGAPPGASDIGVTASAITGLLPNTIELDLQILSSTLPGVRTLLISTLNSDRAVATGMLEVE